jgi:hypothetical protein
VSRHRASVGTLDWTRRTDGILSGWDRWALVGQAVRYGLATMPAEMLRALGVRRRGADAVEPSTLEPPDSRACREAEQLLADTASPMVANHSRRSYAWAAALAALDRVAFDREIVYVASLLHDLYLSRPDVPDRPHCFTLPAADDAIALTRGCGWSKARAQVTAEAITLHANVWPPRHTIEAYLLFAGSRLDVVGYRYRDIDQTIMRAVLEQEPRLDLSRESRRLFRAQASANPGSRLAFLSGLPGADRFMGRDLFAVLP